MPHGCKADLISIAQKQTKASDEKEAKSSKKSGKTETPGQISLFGGEETPYSNIIEALKSIDISQMTPMSAMNKLYELQEMLK